MIQDKTLIIAVDFDGTIVDDAYPKIGKPKMFAIQTLKEMQKDGHRLILWTYRHGRRLKEAVEFMKEQGIEFYAVNRSYPEEEAHDTSVSRKIHADLFIDDRNFGDFPGWGEIYHNLFPQKDNTAMLESKTGKKSGSILSRFLGR